MNIEHFPYCNPLNLAERFWSKVDMGDPDRCWNWCAGKNGDGYGRFRIGFYKHQAHQIAYTLAIGNFSSILCVLHKCDNPSCVNPNHLFLGTHKDNMKDAVRKGRNVMPFDFNLKGIKHPNSKLTEAQVILIRGKKHGMTQAQLAYSLGVSKATVQNVLKGKYYNDVCGQEEAKDPEGLKEIKL